MEHQSYQCEYKTLFIASRMINLGTLWVTFSLRTANRTGTISKPHQNNMEIILEQYYNHIGSISQLYWNLPRYSTLNVSSIRAGLAGGHDPRRPGGGCGSAEASLTISLCI
jgi:hypothetical protein